MIFAEIYCTPMRYIVTDHYIRCKYYTKIRSLPSFSQRSPTALFLFGSNLSQTAAHIWQKADFKQALRNLINLSIII